MNAQIVPRNLNGKVSAVGSKSFAHRALIAAAFFQKQPTLVCGVTPSDDVSATVNCLRALGVHVEGERDILVTPPKEFVTKAVLDCRESGSTYRFLLPLVVSLGISAEFCGSERLFQRPITPLLNALRNCGICDGKKVCGKMSCGDYFIDGSESSQFVSGMLFALSTMSGQSRLFVQGKSVSSGYIAATVSVLKSFGIDVCKTEFGFVVQGGNNDERELFDVEGDWSNVSYFLAAGALGGDVTVSGLNEHSVQTDKILIDVLRDCGASVTQCGDSVRVTGGSLRAFEIDAVQCPDLVPTLAVFASFCNGISKIHGVERLRGKESDRVENVIKTLKVAKIRADFCDDTIFVHGGVPQGGEFFADNDHRMAMSQTLLALHANGKSKIIGCECVKKSYPDFFDDVKKLGGDHCVLLERA